MAGRTVEVRRLPVRLSPDRRRTIVRFFWPGLERAERVTRRVSGLSPGEVQSEFEAVRLRLASRHPDLEAILEDNCRELKQRAPGLHVADGAARLLVGAYFSMEYAFESAALFNPSMAPALDQCGLAPGQVRFLMSLRAIGEGHLSSIVFRRGTLGPDGEVDLAPPVLHARQARMRENATHSRAAIAEKLAQMKKLYPAMRTLLDALPETFTYQRVNEVIEEMRARDGSDLAAGAELLVWLVNSNYEIEIDPRTSISEVVLFPMSQAESQGMEDMRMVQFTDADGSQRLCGTYTAFSGNKILPQMLEARPAGPLGPMSARVHTLGGQYAQNKGLALFPRQVGGRYCMLGRCDGENQYLLTSDRLDFWDEAVLIQQPRWPWEFVQIGNCGSPLQTQAGWLVLTHGVGPMRRYCIGAMLLDLEDPTCVIGQLAQPLLEPGQDESSGYVPNVVYSCGAMAHAGKLVIPYGISDTESGLAVVELSELLAAMRTA